MIERGTSARSSDATYVPGGAPSIVTLRGMWSHADITTITCAWPEARKKAQTSCSILP